MDRCCRAASLAQLRARHEQRLAAPQLQPGAAERRLIFRTAFGARRRPAPASGARPRSTVITRPSGCAATQARELGRVEDLDRRRAAGRRSCTARGTCPDARAAPAGPAGRPDPRDGRRDRRRERKRARPRARPPSCRRASRRRARAAAPSCRLRAKKKQRRGSQRQRRDRPERNLARPRGQPQHLRPARAGRQETPAREQAERGREHVPPRAHDALPSAWPASSAKAGRKGTRYFACLPLTSENATRVSSSQAARKRTPDHSVPSEKISLSEPDRAATRTKETESAAAAAGSTTRPRRCANDSDTRPAVWPQKIAWR